VSVPPDFSPTKDKRAVYVGRLESDTGVELYMQALMLLKETHDLEIPLTVCGDGSMRSELETYCSDRGLDVNFVGFVENPQDFLKSCQFAFVSGYLSILEAMVSRCFVFSVYKNRIKEDYIRLFPDADRKMTINSDPAGLAKNLKEAWEEGDVFREHAERSQSFACDQTWERLAKTYLSLWERP
jgi:glycosyltransferase involved in cell wall biosynthesis